MKRTYKIRNPNSLFLRSVSSQDVRDVLHLVSILFDETANSKTELAVRLNTPVHAVDGPWRLVRVDSSSLLHI